MFIYATIIISIIGLLIATYTDLKERIVTNKLNFSLTLIGLTIYLIHSIIIQNPTPLILSIIGLSGGFIFAWILWKIGVFAGGDVKLFMALGALNPLTPSLLKINTLTNSTTPIFPITLFLYSLIGFLPYGAIIIIYKLNKNQKFKEKLKKEIKENVLKGIKLSILFGAIITILINFEISAYFAIIIILLIETIKKQKILTIILALIALYLSPTSLIQTTITTLIFLVLIYGTIKLMLSIRPLLETEVEIKKLEEGMIPSKTLYFEGKKVKEYSISIKEIILAIKKNQINKITPPKNEIISAIKARGLTNEEIKLLKKLSKEKKIGKTIQIKESMPFVPTMLIGYILCLILGDFWLLAW